MIPVTALYGLGGFSAAALLAWLVWVLLRAENF